MSSDGEGEGGRAKQHGYRLEYATSGRAGCKGPKPCGKENKIEKGALRFGTVVEVMGNTSFAWRHIYCLTPQVISNAKKSLGDDPNDVDGFEDLREEDQNLVIKIFENDKVAREDRPEYLRTPLNEDGTEMTPAQFRAYTKAQAALAAENGEEGEEVKPNVGSSSPVKPPPSPAAKKAPTATPKAKKEKVVKPKPELDEDGNVIKKKPGRIGVKAAKNGIEPKAKTTKAKSKPKASAKGKGKKRKQASSEEEEESAEETAEESEEDRKPTKKAKKSRKSNNDGDSETEVPPRAPSKRARKPTQKSMREISPSEDEGDDRKPVVKEESVKAEESE